MGCQVNQGISSAAPGTSLGFVVITGLQAAETIDAIFARCRPAFAARLDPVLMAEFLIDRGGIIRWVNVECSKEGVSGLGKFPTQDELVSAARIVTG
jgi:hypothetical protein